jgi:Spy/CpxP family protein refolding chaperone
MMNSRSHLSMPGTAFLLVLSFAAACGDYGCQWRGRQAEHGRGGNMEHEQGGGMHERSGQTEQRRGGEAEQGQRERPDEDRGRR